MNWFFFNTSIWGVTFDSLLFTRWDSSRCSLLVVKSSITRCKIYSLLVSKVAHCKKSLITSCRSCSLRKFTFYVLQNSLVTPCRSCLLQKITRYSLQNLFLWFIYFSISRFYQKLLLWWILPQILTPPLNLKIWCRISVLLFNNSPTSPCN